MKVTMTLPGLVAVVLGITGVVMVTLAAFDAIWYRTSWIGAMLLFVGGCGWICDKMNRCREELEQRELDAFNLGRQLPPATEGLTPVRPHLAGG